MNLTLRERLQYANISISRACELFGRTERTLWNWNTKTPQHVLEVINLHGSRHRMPEGWENWTFDRHFFVDPAGNAIRQDEILASKYAYNAYESMTGNKATVFSLKQELEKKLQAQKSPVTIQVLRGSDIIQTLKIAE